MGIVSAYRLISHGTIEADPITVPTIDSLLNCSFTHNQEVFKASINCFVVVVVVVVVVIVALLYHCHRCSSPCTRVHPLTSHKAVHWGYHCNFSPSIRKHKMLNECVNGTMPPRLIEVECLKAPLRIAKVCRYVCMHAFASTHLLINVGHTNSLPRRCVQHHIYSACRLKGYPHHKVQGHTSYSRPLPSTTMPSCCWSFINNALSAYSLLCVF